MPRYLKRWSRWCQQAFFLLVRCCCSLTGCGKSLNRDDSPPQGLKPSLILHDLRGAKAPLYRSAAGFRDFFRSLLSHSLSALVERLNGMGVIMMTNQRFKGAL